VCRKLRSVASVPRIIAKKRATKLVPYSARRRHNRRRVATEPEKHVHTILKEEGIPYTREKQISHCHVDVFIAPHTVIEIQGCFWHKHDCQEPEGGWPVADVAVQTRDEARFAFLRAQGYDVIPIWECDLRDHPRMIRNQLRKLKV
jgi:DNA mismatch endonuclease (patch repair protein)